MTRRDDARVQSDPIPLTREGRRILAAKVQYLRDETIPELLTLRENSGHDSQLESDYQLAVGQLAQLCYRLARACAVETTPDDPRVVELGELVTLCLEDGTVDRYLIVHPFETLVGGLRLSSEAPLGRALLGRRIGDEIEVRAPRGPYRCTIINTVRLGSQGVDTPAPVFANTRSAKTTIARQSKVVAAKEVKERRTRA